MIGKKVPRNPARASLKSKASNIRDLTSYIANPGVEEKLLYENGRNFEAETFAGRQNEMIALAHESARSRDPVSHYVLSWREGEQPTSDQVEDSVTILLEELGLEEHQALYGLHRDTENIHLHVAVNRVHPVVNRVVTPNKGFDIEAVHRAIARIEHAQGWQTLPNARYTVQEDGRVVRRQIDPEAPKQPSQRSRDYEQRTGAKSTERIAIEQAGPLLREARSWDELHDGLRNIGARLERKGSGAVLWLADRPLKASTVDRAASLGALEKRLGPYQGPLRGREGEEGVQVPGTPDARKPSSHGARRGVAEIADIALPVVRTAASWEDLHARLAALGFSYERKGSGAVLRADDRALKASSLHRSAALGALEKRLGPYEPPAVSERPRGVTATPSKAIALDESPPSWAEYAEARRQHYARKEAALVEQRRRHDAERAALRQSQREHREEVLGAARNEAVRQALRSVLAAEHASEKADLRERLRVERGGLREAHPRFPDLEQWLRARDPEEAARWRYRGTASARIEGPAPVPAIPHDIRAFTALVHGAHVHYHRKGAKAQACFVDRGGAIHVHDTRDSAAVLASLQLAAQKWGRFRVAGDESYEAECARLAVEHGFKLENPELQATLHELRAERDARFRRPPVATRPASAPVPEHLDVQPARAPTPRQAPDAGRSRLSDAGDRAAGTPVPRAVTAYYEHHQDVSSRLTGSVVDPSRVDAMIAVRLRATGHDRADVADAIERCAPTIRAPERQGSHRWHDYAQRTAAFAFGAGGDRQLDATRRYHEQWRSIETEPIQANPAAGRLATTIRSAPDAPDL
jgi:hypothetical protein